MNIGFKSTKGIISYIWLMISNLPMPGNWRWHFVKKSGVRFNLPEKGEKFIYIGKNVSFDTMYPDQIEVGNYVHITSGVVLLTHYITKKELEVKWGKGKIIIEDGVFIGINTVISKPVKIGENSIIGAGSVITKDIPKNQVWAGNPAKFIKQISEI